MTKRTRRRRADRQKTAAQALHALQAMREATAGPFAGCQFPTCPCVTQCTVHARNTTTITVPDSPFTLTAHINTTPPTCEDYLHGALSDAIETRMNTTPTET